MNGKEVLRAHDAPTTQGWAEFMKTGWATSPSGSRSLLLIFTYSSDRKSLARCLVVSIYLAFASSLPIAQS